MGFPRKQDGSRIKAESVTRLTVLVLVLSCVCPAAGLGQEKPEPESTPEPEIVERVDAAETSGVSYSRLVASAWCIVKAGKQEERAEDVDGDSDTEEPGEADPDPDMSPAHSPSTGCDVGVGVSLLHFRRLSWVAVIGADTLGTGLAWVVSPIHHTPGPIIAIAIGLVARYDSRGIYAGEVYPAIGATLSFGRAVPGASP